MTYSSSNILWNLYLDYLIIYFLKNYIKIKNYINVIHMLVHVLVGTHLYFVQ